MHKINKETLNHHNNPMYLDIQVWANSVDPGRIKVSIDCHFCLHLSDALLYGKSTLFKLKDNFSNFIGCPNISDFYGMYPLILHNACQ